jgi:solute carrier family 25 phosphate transporter 23/24/25/41
MKILFQVQISSTFQKQGVLYTLDQIFRQEGLKGYFKGNGTNIIRIVPYSAIQFASYEQYKKVRTGRVVGFHSYFIIII